MDALDMITETETSFFSVFVSSYYFLCVRHGPSQENNGSGECQLLVSPGPDVSVCDPQQVMDTDQQVADSSTQGSLGLDLWATFNTEGEAGHKYHPGLIQTIIMCCLLCGLWSLSNEKPTLYTLVDPTSFFFWLRIKETSWDSDKWPSVCINVTWCHMTHSGAWWSQPAAGDLWPGSGRHKEV